MNAFKIGIAVFALQLTACDWFTNGDPKYPPLNKSQIVGCWYETTHLVLNCVEECYDSTNRFYTKFWDVPNLYGEMYGTYSILGNEVGSVLKSKSSNDTATRQERGGGAYTLIGDTLFTIANGTTVHNTQYIHSDSTHNCGPHWQLFQKPLDWDLP